MNPYAPVAEVVVEGSSASSAPSPSVSRKTVQPERPGSVGAWRVPVPFRSLHTDPAIVKKMEGEGYTMVGGTPEHFSEHVRRETAKWGEVIRKAGIKVE